MWEGARAVVPVAGTIFHATFRSPEPANSGVEKRMDDQIATWLADYRSGDSGALGALVEHTRRPLFSFILRMMPRGADAEDIFQEVWFKAIRSLDQFKEGSFHSWLFRITHNLLIDRSRRKRPETSLQEERGEDATLEDLLADPAPTPVDRAGDQDLGVRIRAAVEKLPPEQREVFLLRTEGDVPFKDIAVIQGVSINTALGRMQYAMHRLRSLLETEYADLDRRGG